jgi:hypothetical protein
MSFIAQNKIKIIGNGPSRNLYKQIGTLSEHGCICMCNYPDLPNPPYHRDYVSIVDRRTIDYLEKEKVQVYATIWTTPELKELTIKYKWTTPVLGVYKEKLMNAAATAAHHAIQDFDIIELYGCDALFSDVTTSHQDNYIHRHKRPANLHTRWRTYWEKVWATGKTFRIYCPQGTTPVEYGNNVEWRQVKE